MENTNLSEFELIDVSKGVTWRDPTSGVKKTSESEFYRGGFLWGFSAWGTRIWVKRSWSMCVRVSCDLVALPGSKKHWNLIFAGSSFYTIFRYGELEYEWIWAGGCINKGSVTGSHFRGQKTIETWFLLGAVFIRFFDMGNSNMSESELVAV